MLTEIYIDNFRCLTNFRIEPGYFQLWLGDNGSGKTSTFDALRNIQRFLRGEHIEDIFSAASLTTWDKRSEQTFGFSLNIDDDAYEYQLTIQHSLQENRMRILREELKWKGFTFFLFDGKEVHLYRINRESQLVEEGTHFSADWSRSVISTIAPREDNFPLLRFREEVGSWLLIHPVPLVVKQVADSETRHLSLHAENFAQWYRHILQEKPGIGYKAKESLAKVLPGFEQLSLKETGEARRLTATFRINGEDRAFDFMALSDGQRQLIVLYTVLEAWRDGSFSTLFIDEPDNFTSLREIGPWVDLLNEICDEDDKQAIVVSHHPKIINKMARGAELWFSREKGAHVVVKPYPTTPGLTPAETMARGWDDE